MKTFSLSILRSLAVSALVAVSSLLPLTTAGCAADAAPDGSQSSDVTDVNHTDVENQSIGNCWLYAEASWVESMHLTATGEKFDTSQSYWTYWHWYAQILEESAAELSTGGTFAEAATIIRERGLMPEAKFLPEDATSETSTRQETALDKVNAELATGRLATPAARANAALVRQVLDESWGLSSTIKGQLTKAFGKDGLKTLASGGTTKGTGVIAASAFPVSYTSRATSASAPTVKKTTLDNALSDWKLASYPTTASSRRAFQIRVQKALNDRQPVMIQWDVDFNAMESTDPVLRGSFNMTTLKKRGAGHQGGHMTVMEDYQVVTQQYGTLLAGVTLDPSKGEDKAKLDASLLSSSSLQFIRIKNSWGDLRDARTFSPGFPGYHDLYLDYLNGPIAYCPDVEVAKTATNCASKATPWQNVILPPGY